MPATNYRMTIKYGPHRNGLDCGHTLLVRLYGPRATFPDTITRPTIATPADARAWLRALTAAGIAFHPDDTFAETVDRDTGE